MCVASVARVVVSPSHPLCNVCTRLEHESARRLLCLVAVRGGRHGRAGSTTVSFCPHHLPHATHHPHAHVRVHGGCARQAQHRAVGRGHGRSTGTGASVRLEIWPDRMHTSATLSPTARTWLSVIREPALEARTAASTRSIKRQPTLRVGCRTGSRFRHEFESVSPPSLERADQAAGRRDFAARPDFDQASALPALAARRADAAAQTRPRATQNPPRILALRADRRSDQRGLLPDSALATLPCVPSEVGSKEAAETEQDYSGTIRATGAGAESHRTAACPCLSKIR